MNPKPLLSFCIPTWNRAGIVEEALTDLIPKIRPYGFEIIISDNASTDNTRDIVEKFMLQYDRIYYHCNEENIGADCNFENVLKIAAERSEYAWLLGDSYRLIQERLKDIIPILEQKKYAAILLNCFNGIKGISSKAYSSIPVIIKEIGWHITIISGLIYSARLIQGGNYERYYASNFLQDGILYEYGMLHPEEQYYWYDQNTVTVSKIPRLENHWTKDTFRIFAKNWTNFILSLHPDIPLDVKIKCIRAHSIHTKVFSVRRLIRLKNSGWMDYQRDISPYKSYVKFSVCTSWPTIVCISKSPDWLLQILKYPLYFIEKLRLVFK